MQTEISNDVVETVETPANEAVVTETKPKKTRRANVDDATIVGAWQRIAKQTDEDGNKTGSIQQVADECGMLKASLVQRINALRKMIKENDLTPLLDMPRAKGGGKKKTPEGLAALLGKVNSELGIETEAVDADIPADDNGDEYEDA